MTTKMTAKLFRAVKLMTAGGATMQEIADYFTISTTTISRIRAAETFEEYCSIRTVENSKYRKKKAAEQPNLPETAAQPLQPGPATQQPQPSPQTFAVSQPRLPQAQSQSAQPPQTMPQPPQPQIVEHRQTVTVQANHYMMQEMQKTNELLELISRKLTFIVDQLS